MGGYGYYSRLALRCINSRVEIADRLLHALHERKFGRIPFDLSYTDGRSEKTTESSIGCVNQQIELATSDRRARLRPQKPRPSRPDRPL